MHKNYRHREYAAECPRIVQVTGNIQLNTSSPSSTILISHPNNLCPSLLFVPGSAAKNLPSRKISELAKIAEERVFISLEDRIIISLIPAKLVGANAEAVEKVFGFLTLWTEHQVSIHVHVTRPLRR